MCGESTSSRGWRHGGSIGNAARSVAGKRQWSAEGSRAIYLNTLGNAWSTLFERSKDTTALDQSIIHAQQALQECSPLEPDHGMFSNNLSTKLWERFLLTEIEEDRDEALRLAALAVKETQPSNTRRPQYLHNLGARYHTLYLRSDPGAISDLDRSISLAQQCLDATPHSHSEWSDYATSLGWRLLKRAGELENWDEFDLAVKTFVSAFENETALPVTRVEAGRTAGLLLMTTGRANWPEADRIYRSVIGLLSRVSPRSISRDDMQHRLQGLSNMSSFAAGAALTVKEDPEDALLLLELGRSVIAGLQMSQRSDLPALLASNEDLGRRYTQLRDALSDWRSFPKDTDIVRLKQTQEAELTKLEDEIRQQECLELFNLPPSGDQLRALAVEGPLICFNVTKWRSNAFIVTGRGVESVALPLLEEVDLKQYVNHIIGPNRLTKYSGLQQKAENSKKVRSILEWLWNVAVKAVLDHLELSGLSDSIAALPRLWWVSSGQMGLLPMHAAGVGWDRSKENTVSRVISSYIPSLKALAYARERRQKLVSSPEGDAQPKVLIVDMPHTPEPGWNDLRTAAEVMAIQTAAETAKVPATLMEQPSVTNVLSAMKEHPIVHFACHGDPNTSDPSQTSLVLWQDEENAARLAAASIAADFYNGYLKQYSVSAPTGDAARCLHDAVAAFRTRKKGRGNRADDVIAWAPFVHIGA
ncbi:hypothetical protein M8818_007743 [Zalaria obscura]|uniref:Uncharacterized protein n=1 Tax=Zalaria obscura TaxID=2024903 RepID=A0ACC3S395_9PEZI